VRLEQAQAVRTLKKNLFGKHKRIKVITPINTNGRIGEAINMLKLQKIPQAGDAFTITELMVVILIVAILAAVLVPFLQGRIDEAKWSEACAAAGTIRVAVRAYAAGSGITAAQALVGENLGDVNTQSLLGFQAQDCEGTYFESDDYTITSIGVDGIAVITVTGGSKANSPTGSFVLKADGTWERQ
jgi:prepilin-type N-terminal cleavage/methylation domain-containing protein